MPTLNTDLHQVFLDFHDDPNGYFWHHRVLGVPLGGSVWVGGTPDDSTQRIDLANHRVIVLAKNSAFPAARIHEIYSFDEAAWTAAHEARFLTDFRRLAGVHGAVLGGAVGSGEDWRISDSSSASSGQLVPSHVVGNDDLFFVRGECALVQIENKWTTAAKDEGSNKGADAFARRFQAGPGRDKRLMGTNEILMDADSWLSLQSSHCYLRQPCRFGQSLAQGQSENFSWQFVLLVTAPCLNTTTSGSDLPVSAKRQASLVSTGSSWRSCVYS